MGRCSRRGRGGVTLCAAFVLWAGSVRAAPPAPSAAPLDLDFEYVAAPGCPARAELLEQLDQRVDPRWRSGLDRRSFVLRIERLPDGVFAGRLEVTREGQEPETRELRAENCRAVSAALVVFIAIALDPASDLEHAERAHEQAPSHAPSTLAPTPSATVPPVTSSPPPPPAAASPPEPRREPVWSWSSAVGLAYVRAPRDALGARVDAQIARSVTDRIAPALRLSWGFADFDTVPPNGGEASFRFETARASGCALVDLAPAPFTVAPCLGLDIGALTAKSRNVPQAGQSSTPWSAMSGVLRASWSLRSWLSLEGEAGLLVPFTRPTFALTEPVRIVYRVPNVLFSAGAGLAVSARFP